MEEDNTVETKAVVHMQGEPNTWAQAVAAETGICVDSCYRCLRCTNGCPVSAHMDVKPHQVVRLVQLGMKERLFESNAIWICLGCEMCSTYCPNQINVASLMDHLKKSVVSSARKPAEYDVAVFHSVFLDVVGKYGRMNDLKLMQRYKLKTLLHGGLPSKEDVGADMGLAWQLMKRGRLSLWAESSRKAGEVKRILDQNGTREVVG